jgi:VWFA-related protein
MTTVKRSAALVLGLAIAPAFASPADRPLPEPQSVFRTETSAVSVNVSVTRGNAPVSGLTAADFELRDNGIVQAIRDVSTEAVPVDATLVIDASGSAQDVLEQLKKDAVEIAALMRPIDRLRILAIETNVHEVRPLTMAHAGPAMVPIPRSGGVSSIYDALVAAMIQPAVSDRRHVIVAMTDGYDTSSALEVSAVAAIAARSEAALHVVLTRPTGGSLQRRPWMRRQEFDEDALRAAAQLTGGDLYRPAIFGTGVVRTFRRIFDDFRQSYVLRYTPSGVPPRGWHDLTVTVRTPARLTIRARRGYDAG